MRERSRRQGTTLPPRGGGPHRPNMRRVRSTPGARRRRPSTEVASPPAALLGAAGASPDHVPVLLDAVLAALMPAMARFMSTAPLAAAATARRCSRRRDAGSSASTATRPRCARGAALAARHPGRLQLIEGRFGDMERLVGEAMPGPVAGVALDLGVSSMQLDSAERGFSFRFDGPLDMRMGGDRDQMPPISSRACRRTNSPTLIRSLGEERFARRIARAIVAAAATRSDPPHRRTGGRSCAGRSRRASPGSIPRPAPFRRCASPSTTNSASSIAVSSAPSGC